jgi:pyrimidine operon attenuation protein / uracil phosphoribosyltransferase
MQVLNNYQINQKIKRLSYEILENNLDEDQIVLAGINNNGYMFAKLLFDELTNISDKNITLSRITLNPADPLSSEITSDYPTDQLQSKSIIVVDDVANTGRTIFYAFKVYMNVLVKKVEVAVLVDRKHKMFPIKVDYVGLSLATTVQENIKANLVTEDMLTVDLH